MKAILIVTILVLAGCSRHEAHTQRHPNKTASTHSQTAAIDGRAIIYPYSIVPGGVRTKEDVRAAMSGDTLTAQHYSKIDVATLEPVTLRKDVKAYVSFRKEGKIYWTRNQVHLPAGEKVLSNGVDCIRGRCGNRISFKPQEPVVEEADREPTTEALNTPQTAGMMLDDAAPQLTTHARTTDTFHSVMPELPAPLVTMPGTSSSDAVAPEAPSAPGMPAIPTGPNTAGTTLPPDWPVIVEPNAGLGVPVSTHAFAAAPSYGLASYSAAIRTPVTTYTTGGSQTTRFFAPTRTTGIASSSTPSSADDPQGTPSTTTTDQPSTPAHPDQPCCSTDTTPPGTPHVNNPPSTPFFFDPNTPEVPQDVPEPATSMLVAGVIAFIGLWRALRRDA